MNIVRTLWTLCEVAEVLNKGVAGPFINCDKVIFMQSSYLWYRFTASRHDKMSTDCPRDCHGKGDCTNGVCHCYPGYRGVECNLSKSVIYHVTSSVSIIILRF